MSDSTATLTWGDLDLDEVGTPGATYEIVALATEGEGLELGNPVPVEVSLRSLLQDGSIVFSQGHDNREPKIVIRVTGATGDALAQAESALMRQVGRPRVNLTWRSVTPFVVPGVFEVVTSSLDYDYVPDREHALSRLYVIRLVCLPWVRSQDLVVSSAPVPPRDGAGDLVEPVFVVLDDGSSTARWSSTTGAPYTVGNGTAVSDGGRNSADLIYSAPAPMDATATPYLVLDFKVRAGSQTVNPKSLTVKIDGATVPVQSTSPSLFATYTRVLVPAPATFRTVQLVAAFASRDQELIVTNLARGSFPPSAGTDRQTFRRLPIRGSVRTQGSLRVEHDTDALGDVLVYTWADDGSSYLPPLSSYRPGTPLAVTGTVSGSADNLDTPAVFDAPAAALPDGDYHLVIRARSATTGVVPLVVTVETQIGGTTLDSTVSTATVDVTFDAVDTFEIAPLLSLTLPTVRLANPGAAVVRLTVAAADPVTAAVDLDEAWVFNTSIGSLTQVGCGTGAPTPGGPSRRCWIKPETVAEKPTILRGDAPDASDAFYAAAGVGGSIDSVGTHELRPDAMNVFTVTTGTGIDSPASTEVEYYPRWHTHPVT
ncbi:hypothetical protein [Nocardioides sp. AX2bis]|uniref:hypothetical protein n=1 Tax=Nocardioides sp. AX2bis TaxID=2653157 RepID=UPI0012F425EB|nr:hypothetical protein [Nocardioides sp. AX2bis]VXC43958.1 conserved hypothetical protein [Nocardioides sp. AX2bis]